MLEYLLQIIWFFLPAGFANMSAAFFRTLSFLDYPVDFNKTIRGKVIFGPHKTFRGFFFGILSALIIVNWQKIIYLNTTEYTILDYSSINIWLLGFLLGFGALFGDLARSFVKRRFNLAPGARWFPFDQIDWMLGAILLTFWYVDIPWQVILGALVIAIAVHPLINYTCYLCKLQKNKF